MTAKLIWNHSVFFHADFSLYQGHDWVRYPQDGAPPQWLLISWTSVLRAEQFSRASRRTSPPSCPPITNKGACEGKRADVGWSGRQQRASVLCALSRCLFAAASPPVFRPASAFPFLNLSPENNARVVVIQPEHTCIMMWHFIPVKIQIKVQCLFF